MAVAGENRVDVELPLTYPVNFRVHDPAQRVSRGFDFAVVRFDAQGRQRTVQSQTFVGLVPAFQMRLPAGEYRARLTSRELDVRVAPTKLLDLPITMPEGDASFELEVPESGGVGQ